MPSRIDDLPLLELPDVGEWRRWLDENGASSAGVWLAVAKKGSPPGALTYEQAVEEAVAHGWIDSTAKTLDELRYRQLYTPRKRGSAWSPSNKQRVERLTAQGRMTAAGRAAVDAAKADGSWTLMDDVEALVVPEDLAEAFRLHPQADSGFASLPPSARKQYLYWVASAKRPETRARRIAETVRLAADGRALDERD